MFKKLLLLFIFLVSYFLYFHVSENIINIKEENYELFAIKVNPYKTIQDCYQSGHPRDGVECTTEKFYTEEDERIIDNQESLLGPFPFFKGLLIFVMIATSIWFVWSVYWSIDDFFENRRKKKNWIKQEQLQKQNELKNAQFIEEIITNIRERENDGKTLSFKDVMEIRTKLDNHMDYNAKLQVEVIIRNHMKKYNPKWK